VRDRIRFETKDLWSHYSGALWASERWLKDRPALVARLRATRHGIERAFGWKARIASRIVGAVVYAALWREDRRLRKGKTYEPQTFYDVNPAAAARQELASSGAAACRFVEPPVARPAVTAEAAEAVA